MVRREIPYLHRVTRPSGRVHYYYRRRGYPRVRLPAPTDPDFSAAYHAAGGGDIAVSVQAGTLSAVVAAYRASPEYAGLSPASRAYYETALRELEARFGDKRIAALKTPKVLELRDEKRDRPSAANNLLAVLSVLCEQARMRGLRHDNPVAGVRRLKTGEWRAWTQDELDAFRARWPRGTMERRAFALALYTTQRVSDLIRMTQADRRDGAIKVTQAKTGRELWIPEHPALTEELAHCRDMVLLMHSRGRAFASQKKFSTWFKRAIRAAGLPEECVTHGLRKAGITALAEAGCTDAEIQAVSGQSPEMVAYYRSRADQRRLASAAVLRLRGENGKV